MALEVVADSMPVDSEQRSCCGLSRVFNHAFQIANADWNRVVFLATSNFFLDLRRRLDRCQLVVPSIMATSSLVESMEPAPVPVADSRCYLVFSPESFRMDVQSSLSCGVCCRFGSGFYG